MTYASRLFAILLCALSLHAQSTSGRLSGSVTDPSGAATPDARVAAVNNETGQKVTDSTSMQGQFVLYPLPPGNYKITIEKTGFNTFEIPELKIDVSQSLIRNVTLALGTSSQSVSVVSEAAALETESHSVQSTITRRQIEELPLNGRDFNQLVLLTAGAVDNNVGGGTDFGSVALNGNRTYGNSYLIDGTPNNNAFQNTSAVPLSIDVIREFKVISGVAPAEYGQGGAQVSVVTRGGTNTLHGNLFEYYRGNVLQARDPFNPTNAQPFQRNQFGGSVGGAVVKNRTFFLFNYEGNRQYQQETRVASVPLDAFWKGDFSALLPLGVQLRDPLVTGRPNIPGNRLDQYLGGVRINKTALALQPYFPSPNLPGIGNNSATPAERATVANQFTLRGDQIVSNKHTVGARFTKSHSEGFIPNILGSPGVGRNEPFDNSNGSASWTAVINARTVSEFRAGANKYGDVTSYFVGNQPTALSLGLQGFSSAGAIVPLLPQLSFSGPNAPTNVKFGDTPTFGEAALSMIQNIYTFSETVSHMAGKHSLKFGYEFHRDDFNVLQQSNAGGQIAFAASATSNNSTGYAFSDLLIGVPSSSQQVPVKPKILLKQTQMAAFFQDDWRIASRFTLSMGLRHELFLNPYEARNRLAMFDINSGGIVVATDNGTLPVNEYLPAIVSKLADASGNFKFPVLSDVQAGFNPRRLLDTQVNNWGPRFGFSWNLQNRTVLRGGYGMFYSRYPIQYLLQTVAVNPPFAGLFTYSQSIQNGVPALTLNAPFISAGGNASISPSGIQKDFGLPDNQQWNLAIERDLGWQTTATVSFVGNKGTHLFRSINANSAYIDPTTKAIVRRFATTYGTSTINFRQTDGNSSYRSMNAEIRRRASKNLLFQANWVWAKGLDDTGSTVQAALLDVQNLGRDRANSDYVRRHNINANFVYDLPVGRNRTLLSGMPKWADAAVGGWRVSGIFRRTTGRFLTPTFTSSGGLSNSRPDVVYGVSPNLPADRQSPDRWFNAGAFATVPATDPATGSPRFGNAGRNTIIGPGLNMVDANLAKVFPLAKERKTITLRLEAFNLLNHANYGTPALNISNTSTVATISNVLRPMRQVQFAVRFDF